MFNISETKQPIDQPVQAARADACRKFLEISQIEGVLLDLDDTLLQTEQVFQETFSQIANGVARYAPEHSLTQIRAVIDEVNEKSFSALGANIQQRAPMIARGVCEIHRISAPDFEEEISTMVRRIYEIPPRLKPHALDLMETLHRADVPRSCVTHANAEWTQFKLAKSGLLGMFSQIVVVDENTKKSVESWNGACANLGVNPERALVIGDSLRSDIRPARQLGVRNVAWLNDGHGWQHNSVGGVPEGVMEFRTLGELLMWILGEHRTS